jgi:hypothetical protein
MTVQARRSGSARVSRAGERVLAIANFPCHFWLVIVEAIAAKRVFRPDAETSTRDACAPQIVYA